MGTWKKWLAVALCVLMACALGACSMVSVNEDRDNAQVVAKVNGTEITKDLYNNILANMLYQYGMTEAQLEEDKETGESVRQSALDELVSEELLFQQAQKEGLVDDSDEHKAELKAEQEASMNDMLDYYKELYAQDETIKDPDAEAQKMLETYKENYGLNDMDKYLEDLIHQEATQAMYDKIVEDVTFTEDDAKEYYDMQIETQQPAIEKDPANYQLYASFGTPYVNPPGYKYVKNLLIGLPEDVQNEINTLRSGGDDEAADKLRDEELAKIKSQADDALKRAQAGEDFDALIEELGTDTGMQAEPAKTYGYLVHEGSDYVPEFEEASLALQNEGDISGLVPTDFGYHIIQYTRDGEGPIPFEMVKDDIMSSQLSSEKSMAYSEYVAGLKEDADIKTYPNRLTA